ncbi:UNVERIFIED_CONTAM: hypothetical protein HDU68_007310 [Siphonaria sp. JEL0065]|nr:hypothetical protein HDU68_007310 [Siphonaria sp. JEL0065]
MSLDVIETFESKRDISDAGYNPFSAWPVLGRNWTIGAKPDNMVPGLKGLGCFAAPSIPIGVGFDFEAGSNCPPGFYCPFLDPSDPATYPSLCPPTTYCAMVRLLGNRLKECMNQCYVGMDFIVQIPKQLLLAQKATTGNKIRLMMNESILKTIYSISGSVAPQKCRPFSICPTGSIAEANYALILLFLLLDFLLFSYLTFKRASELIRQGQPALSVIPGYTTLMKYRRRQIRKRRATMQSEQIERFTRRESFITGNVGGGVGFVLGEERVRESNTTDVPDVPKFASTSEKDPNRTALDVTELRTSDTSTYKCTDTVPSTSVRFSILQQPPAMQVGQSQLDIDYPDESESEELQESLSLKSTADLARLEMCSLVSNVSPLLEAFHSAFNGIENLRMNLNFTDLRYCLGEKVILDSVSGEIKAGRMTAILGPSGAGKTTFVNVLMGKVERTSGDLTINGVQAEMHTFRKIIGYVPQDDIMLRELTVREVIHYSARTRLPKDWTSKRVDELVDAILKVLNLEHIAHTQIGDELNRGISGGQRKRVNIAMELAAEIFNTFDDVLMIIPGGKTAYFGPVKKAKSYFEDFLGFHFEKESNPADVMMDILSGRGKMNGEGATSMKPEAIARSWKEGGYAFVYPGEGNTKKALISDTKAVQSMKSIVASRGASFVYQLWNAHQRSLTQQARTSGALFMEIWVGMVAGLIMGIAGRCDEMYHGVVVAPYRQLSSTPNEWFLGLCK